jgi:hypothetical protein
MFSREVAGVPDVLLQDRDGFFASRLTEAASNVSARW